MSDDQVLNWTVPDPVQSLGTLPIRFHTADGEVVASGVSGRDIAVPSGEFYLGVTLPNGREVIGSQMVDTRAGAAELPSLATEIQRNIALTPLLAERIAPTPIIADTPPVANAPAAIEVARWQGDWIAAWGNIEADTAATPLIEWSDPVALDSSPLRIERAGGLDNLLVARGEAGHHLFVLPYDRPLDGGPSQPGTIEARLKADGTSITFTSPVACETNAFIEFVDTGLLSESKRLSLDLIENGDRADAESASTLIRAVLGAYVLLRANDTDHLGPATEHLLAVAPDCPDARIIRVETLARQGDHDRALAALRDACVAGCPWFRSGISYQLERLKFYLAVDQGNSPFALDEATRVLFDLRRARLDRMAARMDLTQLFSAFLLPTTPN